MNRDNERSMVKKLIGGDKQAFEKFYRQEQKKLGQFILQKVENGKDAEELMQDTWLAFLDALPLFSFQSSLETFLFSIARHEVADYYRRKYAKKVIKLVPLVSWIYTEKLYSSERVVDDVQEMIDKAYEKIAPVYARILRLKYEEEMSVREIAERLEISVKAAESKLFRARKAFQLAYSELEDKQ